MTEIATSLGVIDSFIGVAKDMAKLPSLVLPQYRDAARDMYQISQKLLTANENLSRWMHRFLYFDFRHDDARTKFLDTVAEYKTMKTGPEYPQLKYSCGDIGHIYYRNIDSKLGNLFTRRPKREQVEGVFYSLSEADAEMVAFIYDYAMARLDDFVNEAEADVNSGAMDAAEGARLRAKIDLGPVTRRLEVFSEELSDLVLQFAQIAREPVTLSQ